MDALGIHVFGALALLAAPLNLLAMLAGLLAGALGSRVVAHLGLDAAAMLALLFPIAALLDPTTALILLASAWAAALVASAPNDQTVRLLGIAALVVGTIVIAVGAATVFVPKLAAADKVSLLAAAAAVAVMCHTGSRAVAGWAVALALIVAGVALELTAMRPIDSAQTSPRAVLLGLLVSGPAIAVLLRPHRATDAVQSSPFAWPATLLPLLLFSIPMTATAALLSLALAEHGLSAGHALMTQRSRLALALVLVPFVAALTAMLILVAARRVPRPAWMPAFDPTLFSRVAAAFVATLSLSALAGLGVERMELIMLAVTALIGGALHWFGQSPALLVIGLAIGELMRPALTPALRVGITDIRAGLLPALAGIAIIAALAWPWLRGAVRGRSA
jgi:TctA family transporter